MKINEKDILKIEDIEFSNFKKQKYGTLIGFSKNYIIKIELYPHTKKRNNIQQEADIIKYINKRNCICVPNFKSLGQIEDKQYIIMERIYGNKKSNPLDILFSFMALAGIGIIHGDLKPNNYIHNGLYTILIDFDQAILDNNILGMTLEQIIKYIDANYKFYGYNLFEQLQNINYQKFLFKGRLNLKDTTLFKLGYSTNSKDGIYHSLLSKKIYVKGERENKERFKLLKDINFSGENVLDVGANTGELTRFASKTASHVDGIEYCKEHAIAGQLINSCENITNAFIYHGDVIDKWPKVKYDTVLLFSVLHHIEEQNDVIENIKHNAKRIIIECRLNEKGFKYKNGTWINTQIWKFSKLKDMINWLSYSFNMKFVHNYGKTERNRYILEFVKENS